MRTLTPLLALLLVLLFVQPGGSAVPVHGQSVAHGSCQCGHGAMEECPRGHYTSQCQCAASCAGGCGPALFVPAGGSWIQNAAGPAFAIPHASAYSDITLPVPHPPPIA